MAASAAASSSDWHHNWHCLFFCHYKKSQQDAIHLYAYSISECLKNESSAKYLLRVHLYSAYLLWLTVTVIRGYDRNHIFTRYSLKCSAIFFISLFFSSSSFWHNSVTINSNEIIVQIAWTQKNAKETARKNTPTQFLNLCILWRRIFRTFGCCYCYYCLRLQCTIHMHFIAAYRFISLFTRHSLYC